MSTTMDESQLNELQDTFQIFDTKGDNQISVSQVGDVLRATGQNPTEADIRSFVANLDPKGRISFDVFVPIYQVCAKNANRYSYDEIVEGLRNFDTEASGYINVAQFRHMLTALGEKMSEDEVEQLLDGVATDDDGRVHYESFVKLIMKPTAF